MSQRFWNAWSVLIIAFFTLATAQAADKQQCTSVQPVHLPLAFEANHGQADCSIRFIARGTGYEMAVGPASSRIVLHRARQKTSANPSPEHDLSTELVGEFNMKFVGGDSKATGEGQQELITKPNYFIGQDSKKWLSNIPNYREVLQRNVYPGIDVIYHGSLAEIEHDFIVHPGANVNDIQVLLDGADSIRLTSSGDLQVQVWHEQVMIGKPTVYQTTPTGKTTIAGEFVVQGKNRYSFNVAAYDKSQPLVIDPSLKYSTFFGGPPINSSQPELRINAITTGSDGSAYIAGEDNSELIRITDGAFQPAFKRNQAAFVTKLTPDGSNVIYSTYLGGSFPGQRIFSIAVDSHGNAYVGGTTQSIDFPVANAIQPTVNSGTAHGFVTEFDTDGTALIYSTYVGGGVSTGGSYVLSVALDGAGELYVGGGTTAPDFPATSSAYNNPGSAGNGFLAKINAAGSSYQYVTLFNLGSGNAAGGVRAIALDGTGAGYATANTGDRFH